MPTLLEMLKAGQGNRKRVPWPGSEGAEVDLRPLTDQDQLEAGMAADQLYRDAKLDIGMANIQDYEAEKTTQLLWRAVCDPQSGGRLCKTIAEFRSLLTRGVRAALVQQLEEFTQECSPPLNTMGQEQYDALVARVKKTPEAASSVSSICTLRRLCMSLAVQLATSQTGSGST